MRRILSLVLFATSLMLPSGVGAREFALNHLDCRFNEATQSMACPDVVTGRAAAATAPAAAVVAEADAPVSPGTPEWNAKCAAKYKSFDPATGMYRGFSGQLKPCK